MKKNKQSRSFQIKDLETLRAVSDPLRVQIVELLIALQRMGVRIRLRHDQDVIGKWSCSA